MMMILLSYATAEMGSGYELFFHGFKTTTTELSFPFIEEKSNAEFTANFVVQCVVGGLGFTAYVGIEVAMSIFDDFATISPKLVKSELGKLSDMIENMHLTRLQIQTSLKDAIKLSLRSDEYEYLWKDSRFCKSSLN